MKLKAIPVILCTLLVCTMVQPAGAQSAVSNVITFSLSDLGVKETAKNANTKGKEYTQKESSKKDVPENNLFMPPDIYVDIDFVDANNNRILEALESGSILITLHNKGGNAEGVTVDLSPMKTLPGLRFDKLNEKVDLPSDANVVTVFPLSAGIDIPTDSLQFNIRVSEPLGYDVDARLILSTFEYQKAKMSLQGVSILDAGKGLRASGAGPDGKVQKGEVVRAVLTLQNVGDGMADGVEYTIETADPNVLLMTETGIVKSISGTLDRFLIGEVKEFSFRLSANNNYKHKGEWLPVYLSVKENAGFGDIVHENVPIPLDAMPAQPKTVAIKGEKEKLRLQQQTRVYSSSNRISSLSSVKDINIAPSGDPLFPDAVAIVIGAERNMYGAAPAPYAARDAQVMSRYFKNSMGINDIKLITDEQVTGTALSDLFDPYFGYLTQVVEPGKTDVFVYYSGHGLPVITKDGQQDVYLFPYDARRELVQNRGYSLNKLYADLNALNAKSVTVIMDACFSGSSRRTATVESENISREKGVRIALPQLESKPWKTNAAFRVFTSSAGDQTSLGYDAAQAGLFTYYLALGLQGEADADKDGTILLDELVQYVTDQVSAESVKIKGGSQTPQFFGSGDFIIERIK